MLLLGKASAKNTWGFWSSEGSDEEHRCTPRPKSLTSTGDLSRDCERGAGHFVNPTRSNSRRMPGSSALSASKRWLLTRSSLGIVVRCRDVHIPDSVQSRYVERTDPFESHARRLCLRGMCRW